MTAKNIHMVDHDTAERFDFKFLKVPFVPGGNDGQWRMGLSLLAHDRWQAIARFQDMVGKVPFEVSP